MPLPKAKLEALLREGFRLDGEQVIRVSTGKAIRHNPKQRYTPVCLRHPSLRRPLQVGLHRLKFFLVNGYLPDTVDHKSRLKADNSGDNLRAASMSLQNHNQHHPKKDPSLPRGVVRLMSKAGPRYRAQIRVGSIYPNLGTYDNPEDAEAFVVSVQKAYWGKDYSDGSI